MNYLINYLFKAFLSDFTFKYKIICFVISVLCCLGNAAA